MLVDTKTCFVSILGYGLDLMAKGLNTPADVQCVPDLMAKGLNTLARCVPDLMAKGLTSLDV